MSTPDPLEGQFADVELIEGAVYASTEHAIWTGTGGTEGCAQCRGKTFAERVAVGGRHITCAYELARADGAKSVPYGMRCGDLRARLLTVITDPRLGQWRHHLDWWATSTTNGDAA